MHCTFCYGAVGHVVGGTGTSGRPRCDAVQQVHPPLCPGCGTAVRPPPWPAGWPPCPPGTVVTQLTHCSNCWIKPFAGLQQDPPEGVNASPQTENIMHWNAIIFGPDGEACCPPGWLLQPAGALQRVRSTRPCLAGAAVTNCGGTVGLPEGLAAGLHWLPRPPFLWPPSLELAPAVRIQACPPGRMAMIQPSRAHGPQPLTPHPPSNHPTLLALSPQGEARPTLGCVPPLAVAAWLCRHCLGWRRVQAVNGVFRGLSQQGACGEIPHNHVPPQQ